MSAGTTKLMVRHVSESDPPKFEVVRLPDGKPSEAVALPSPYGYTVEGQPTTDLMGELRWYLERFLEYPFDPATDRAARVQQALRKWGTEAFEALFGNRSAWLMLAGATSGGYAHLDLRIVSDDPAVLSWPWEALHDTSSATLAHTCQIERRLNKVADPPTLPALPTDRVNILLVTARPYEDDVRFGSIARPLISLIAEQNLPAHVEVLRPPTFDRLREHLRERPGYYHLLHFDGHGSYRHESGGEASPGGHVLKGREGHLIFEEADGSADPVKAETLSTLLREHAVPAVVLSACQSAMLDPDARDPFASVAASLLKAGMRSVVAMAWSLYVSGAREFLPAFYRQLFNEGSVVRAVRAGRQQMLAQPARVCARGKHPLEDWCVPVLYQHNEPLDFRFVAQAPRAERRDSLPEEVQEAQGPHGMVGRDGAMLAIERAMRRPPAAVVLTGLGGIGKTTLAAGFLTWLRDTGGLGKGALWFSFADVRSAESVINRMGEALFGSNFGAADLDTRLHALTQAVRAHRYVIVWDNFETVRGVEGTYLQAQLSEADQSLLVRLLTGLRGGASKVLITSRSPEDWLGHEQRFPLALKGLDREERWEYCGRLLDDLGLKAKQDDKALDELMKLLEGHPLAMRVVLPRLASMSAAALLEAVRSNLGALGLGTTGIEAKFYATLRVATDALPPELTELLLPLALHEGFVVGALLEALAEEVDRGWTKARVSLFLRALSSGGLLHERAPSIFEMHPALTGYLRTSVLARAEGERRDMWTRAFVDAMGTFADGLAPRPLHEQRAPFILFGASFRNALAEARRLSMLDHFAALTQSLATYALNTRDLAEAERLFANLAEHERSLGNDRGNAAALHQLGVIAQERRDFAAAEKWYLESLAIDEKQGNKQHAANTYHQLGGIAQERRDFDAAEQWYLKSLTISEKQGNKQHAANTYHQLGRIAQERRDFDAAEQWSLKSLTISEKQGNEQHAANTYHQLGRIAQERRDFDAAEQWYLKSLTISEKQGNEHSAAISYHQLGTIAHERRDFDAAEKWYLKSLTILEKQGNEHGAAGSYHQLGIIAQDRRDFGTAEKWYLKSLAISEKQRNEHNAASTSGQLGVLALLSGRFEDSGRWFIRAGRAFVSANDPHYAAASAHNFAITLQRAPADVQAKLAALWTDAGLGPLPSKGGNSGLSSFPTKPPSAIQRRVWQVLAVALASLLAWRVWSWLH